MVSNQVAKVSSKLKGWKRPWSHPPGERHQVESNKFETLLHPNTDYCVKRIHIYIYTYVYTSIYTCLCSVCSCVHLCVWPLPSSNPSKFDPNMYARVRHIQVITVDLPSNKGGTPCSDLSNLTPGEDPSKCFCSICGQLQMPCKNSYI